MRVCLLASEYFGLGTYGGFAAVARQIAEGLAREAVRVTVALPRRHGQADIPGQDGIEFVLYAPWRALSPSTYAGIDADVFHSIEPTVAAAGAMRAHPDKVHIASFLNPYSAGDWRTSLRNDARPPLRRAVGLALQWCFFASPPVRKAVCRCDATTCTAAFLQEKARALFRLPSAPLLIPAFTTIPDAAPTKAARPTVCFVGRLDAIKRPELFLALAARNPDVRFVVVGSAKDPHRDDRLRRQYGGSPNLEWRGFIDQFRTDGLSKILGQSWILVNTSAKEGLPGTYLEAAAHRCAILSCNEADGFVERGGLLVPPDGFHQGLQSLLEHNHWRALGERGYAYVREHHAESTAIAQYLALYASLTRTAAPAPV